MSEYSSSLSLHTLVTPSGSLMDIPLQSGAHSLAGTAYFSSIVNVALVARLQTLELENAKLQRDLLHKKNSVLKK